MIFVDSLARHAHRPQTVPTPAESRLQAAAGCTREDCRQTLRRLKPVPTQRSTFSGRYRAAQTKTRCFAAEVSPLSSFSRECLVCLAGGGTDATSVRP